MMATQVLAWAALALAVVVVAVLVAPVRLALWVSSQPDYRAGLDLSLLGGIIPALPIIDTGRRRAKRKRAAGKHEARRPGRRRSGSGLARVRRVLGAAPGILRSLRGAVRIRQLAIDCRFGLGDPADTGQLFGMIAPLIYGSPWHWPPPASLSVTPDFDRVCLEGRADVVLDVAPLRLLPPALRIAWAAFGRRR
ncbi:MAG: DUF2953 domain-containing protein [Burkholderiaceae bacterium]